MARSNISEGLQNTKYCLVDASAFQPAVGELIGRARKQAGLNQEQLAKRMGVTRNTIGNIETGAQNVSFQQIARFCRILNVPITEFVPDYLSDILPKPDISREDMDRLSRLIRGEGVDKSTSERGG